MKITPAVRNLLLIWLGWAVLLSAFQFWSIRRVDLDLPDNVIRWSADESNPATLAGKVYLNDPFLNEHVAWDSEYYLSIAMFGYDDPEIRGVPYTGDKGYYTNFCVVGGSSPLRFPLAWFLPTLSTVDACSWLPGWSSYRSARSAVLHWPVCWSACWEPWRPSLPYVT